MKKVIDILFYIGLFILEISTVFVNVIFIQNHLNKLKMISVIILTFCCIFKLFEMRTNFKNWITLFLIVLIGFLSYFITSSFLLLELILLIIASLNLDFDEIIKKDFKFKLFILFALVILYFLGYTNGMLIHRPDGLIRYSFGFYHPNLFSMFLVLIYLEYTYVHKENFNIWKIIWGLFIFFLIMNYADSRTAGYVLILFMFFLKFKKIGIRIMTNKVVSFLSKNLFLILLLICLVVTVLFNKGNDLAISLNTVFSSRIYIQNLFLKNYDITLLGNNIQYLMSLDNAYLRILLNFGLIGVLIYNFIIKKIMNKSYECNDYYIYIIFIIFLIYGVMENLMFNIAYNIFWLYIIKIFIKEKKYE